MIVSAHDAVRAHLYATLGAPQLAYPNPPDRRTLERGCEDRAFMREVEGRLSLVAQQTWVEVHARAVNRLQLGSVRYGAYQDPFKPAWDCLGRVKLELAHYRATGDLECLVEVLNHCMLFYGEGPFSDRPCAPGIARLDRFEVVLDAVDAARAGCRGSSIVIAVWCVEEYAAPSHAQAHWTGRADGVHTALR